MKIDSFYERTAVIHEVVESERSEICFDLINNLVFKEIGLGTKSKILDMGCGDGSFIAKFRDRCRVFGIDISSKAVKLAEKAGVNAYRSDISSERLPFEDECFDLVYMGDVIEHLINPDFAITETARVMKPSGFLILSTPNLASWLNRLLLLVGFQPLSSEVSTAMNFGRPSARTECDNVPVGHLRLFTFRALKEFLAYYSFRIVKARGASSPMRTKVLSEIDKVLSRIVPLASIVIVVACKDGQQD
jgi:methionine biosynthesis protein MetW